MIYKKEPGGYVDGMDNQKNSENKDTLKIFLKKYLYNLITVRILQEGGKEIRDDRQLSGFVLRDINKAVEAEVLLPRRVEDYELPIDMITFGDYIEFLTKLLSDNNFK